MNNWNGDILSNFQQVIHNIPVKEQDESQMSMKPWKSSLACNQSLYNSLHTT